jgi:hypothetical protein
VTLGLLVAACALLLAGCGTEPARPSAGATQEAAVLVDSNRGFMVKLPAGWTRASAELTPQISDPREILTVATLPIAEIGPPDGCGGGVRPAVAAFTETDALVTVQESGRGALRINYLSHPPRPEHFRPEDFPDGSTFTDCFVGDVPVEDHWFGFADAHRAFHVLVIVGRRASTDVRRNAWEILDSLRFDADVRPDWPASP